MWNATIVDTWAKYTEHLVQYDEFHFTSQYQLWCTCVLKEDSQILATDKWTVSYILFCRVALIMDVITRWDQMVAFSYADDLCCWHKLILSLPSSFLEWVSWGVEIWEGDRRRWGRPSSPRTPRARPQSGHLSASPETLRRIGIANMARISIK